MQARTPLVSIIVPSFNAAPFLPALCQSLQAQTFRDFEVLIGDDASTDGTREAVAPFLADARFRYLRWDTNRGVTQSTQLLLGLASGEFWGYPGADDLYEPSFLQERLELLTTRPTVGFVHGPPTIIDETGAAIAGPADYASMEKLPWPEREILPGSQALALLLQHNVVSTPSVLIRMAATRSVLAWMKPEWRYAQDWSYWILHAASGYDVAFDRRPLHRYRIVSTSLSNDPGKAACRQAEVRLVPLWALSRAAEFSFPADELWARWGRSLYALWLRRAWGLARAGSLRDSWMVTAARAYYGTARGRVALWREVVRHGGAILRSSRAERAARQRQAVPVSGLAQIDQPIFRRA
jgi:glycosyltransferase involved in cell wall biosynthesis